MTFKKVVSPLVIVTATFLFFLISKSAILNHPPAGDEPHYLIMAISLIQDHDLELSNNYNFQTYQDIGCARLTPHRINFTSRDIYPYHPPGLSILATLPYRIGGRQGVVLLLNVISIITAWILFKLILLIPAPQAAAAILASSLFLNLPWVLLSGTIFPELFGALAIIAILYLNNRPQTRWNIFLLALSISFLPWFHLRYTLFSATGLILYFLRGKPFPHIRLMLSTCITAALLYLFYFQSLYGDCFFQIRFQTGGFSGFPRGIMGIILDRETGIFVYAPYLIFAAGGLFFLKKRDIDTIITTCAALLYLILTASWVDWHGGYCPPSRYIVPLIPFLIYLSAICMNRFQSRIKWFVWSFLGIWSFMITVYALKTNTLLAWVEGDGINRLLSAISGNIMLMFPSWRNPIEGTMALTLSWCMLIVSALIWMTPHPQRRFTRTAKFAVVIIMLLIFPIFLTSSMTKIKAGMDRNDRMPLSQNPARLISPADGTRFQGKMPELSWTEVPGAEGYYWRIFQSVNLDFKVEVFGDTHVKIPDSVATALPSGKYYWSIIPFKGNLMGRESKPRCFHLVK